MGELRQFKISPCSKWSSARFSLLLTDHDEYYFRWHEAVAVFDIVSTADTLRGGINPSARICAPGLLHICANGIFFEPQNIELPILRITYKYWRRLIPWSLSDDDRLRLQRIGVPTCHPQTQSQPAKQRPSIRGWLGQWIGAEPHNQSSNPVVPWEMILVDSENVTMMCCHGLHHPSAKVDSFGPICFAVKPDSILKNLERSVVELLSILVAMHAQAIPTDYSSLLQLEVVAHETRELAYSPLLAVGEVQVCRGRAVQVEPLLHIPGRFLLTNKAIYFLGFHQRRHDEELCMSLSSLFRVARRRHIFDDTGLEIRQKTGASHLFIFSSHDDCRLVWRHLSARPSLHMNEELELEGIMKAWQMGAISNFHYLLHLNSMAHRSFNDIAQYPVMPWVISDYTSQTLDLSSNDTFRDLSKPIGALQPERLAELMKRFEAMDEPKYLYGTHYSTPAYVVFFLVRKAPLLALRFHGGKFDNADRAFSSIESTWSTCLHNPADVKELIPEFYSGDGDFLVNKEMLPLGVKQCGEVVHDVHLPPWATSPREFVTKSRAALESDHVSASLNLWIDLIFGCLQRGSAAIEAKNVFHPFSYEGTVVLKEIVDECSRRACADHICEFGQIPKQLFKARHPQRTGPLLLRPMAAVKTASVGTREEKSEELALDMDRKTIR